MRSELHRETAVRMNLKGEVYSAMHRHFEWVTITTLKTSGRSRPPFSVGNPVSHSSMYENWALGAKFVPVYSYDRPFRSITIFNDEEDVLGQNKRVAYTKEQRSRLGFGRCFGRLAPMQSKSGLNRT